MKQKVYFSYISKIEIPFFDVDMIGIAWHGHYVKYFEVARCEMLEALGYNYLNMKEDGYIWPVVDLQIKYIKPAKFSQKIIVLSEIIEYENRLKVKYTLKDSETLETLTKGSTTQLVVDIKTQRICFETPVRWQKIIADI